MNLTAAVPSMERHAAQTFDDEPFGHSLPDHFYPKIKPIISVILGGSIKLGWTVIGHNPR